MKLYLCLFAVLSALLAFSCGEVKGSYFSDPDNDSDGGVFTTECGETIYNASTHFCSGDGVYIRCNGGEYDPETEFCFNKRVYKKCDGKDYDAAKEFCSEIDKVYTLCNGEQYKVTNQLCFKGEIKRKCPNSSFEDEFCEVNGKDTTSYRICGEESYKSADKFCVKDSEIWDKCGTGKDAKEYDPYKQFCLSGSYYDLCNGKMLSPVNDFCFDNKVYPKCKGETYNPNEKFCEKETQTILTLCNGIEYKSYEFCSPDDIKVHSKCGRTEYPYYNTKERICIRNEETNKDSLYYICENNTFSDEPSCNNTYLLCKNDIYNPRIEFCYDGMHYRKCGSGTGAKEYDPNTQACYPKEGASDGKVYDKCQVQVGITDFGTPIYEYKEYDITAKQCKDGVLKDKYVPPKCDAKSTEFCCFGKIYNKTDPYFCYEDELYTTCGRPSPTYRPTIIDTISKAPLKLDTIAFDTTSYPPSDSVCFKANDLKPKCSLPKIQGNCVDGTLLRCRQLGSGPNQTVDPLPGMTCEANGAIIGTSNNGIPIAQIGTQVWMRKNLDVGLLDWAAAMGIDAGANSARYTFPSDRPHQGICPPGFYTPTDADWKTLMDYAGGAAFAGGRLKDSLSWNGLNAYGFNALPNGYFNGVTSGGLSDVGTRAMWWSVDQAANVENASYWTIISADTELRTHNQSKGLNKAHVRCMHY